MRNDPIWLHAAARRTITLLVLATASLVLTSTGARADWRLEPLLRAGGEWDDNATLSTRTDDIIDLTGYLWEASVRFDYSSPRTNFFITPRYLSRNYPDHEDISSDDTFLASLFTHETQSNSFSFRTRYGRESVRTAERADTDLDESDPDEIPDDSSGLVSVTDRLKGRREKWRFTPAWTHQFSDESSLGMSFMWVDTSYDEAVKPILNDYNDGRLNLTFSRAFSARTDGLLTATGRRFTSDNDDAEVDGYGIKAGFDHLLSPTTRARVLVGAENAENNVGEGDTTWVADLSLRRNLETISLLAQFRRSLSASGAGTIAIRNSVNLNLTRRLTEKISAGLGARAYQTSSLDDRVTINERDYVQLRARFTWHITPKFSTEVDYRYTFQNRAVLLESANSNQVNLWLVWEPNSQEQPGI